MARLLLIVLAAALSKRIVVGFPNYRDRIPNSRSFSGINAIGHVDPNGGGERNAFGLDFGSNGFDWAEICDLDSDDDGLTNGQELGDPCCQWTSSNPTALIDTGLSHPGEATDVSENPQLLNATCSNQVEEVENESSTNTNTTPVQLESKEEEEDDERKKSAATSCVQPCLLWILVVSNLIFF